MLTVAVPETGQNKAVWSIPEILKTHRAHHLFNKHRLFQIPLANPDLEERFSDQVFCTENVYEAGEKSVLVVFAHDFGNLRVETDSGSTTNVSMVNSYLLDTSDTVVDWVLGSGYNMIDVNVMAHLPTQFAASGPRMITKAGPKAEGKLLQYIWDNYVELAESEHVILIGHGTGCRAIMDLVNHRNVQQKVRAVVQVAGMHSIVRIDPDHSSRFAWFHEVRPLASALRVN